jgi:hypothetical protein
VDEQTITASLLRKLMSGISEDYWCAGWLSGLEYTLWDAVTGKRKNVCSFRRDRTAEVLIGKMRRMDYLECAGERRKVRTNGRVATPVRSKAYVKPFSLQWAVS